jgi:hypothetical protein
VTWFIDLLRWLGWHDDQHVSERWLMEYRQQARMDYHGVSVKGPFKP